MDNPWTFGWAQLLTLIGFAITITIAGFGFRSFRRWRREKLEERRIEIAFEALAMAYESKYVFEDIRGPMSFPYEWADMPEQTGETDQDRQARGAFYAVLMRINRHKDFFDRLVKLLPKFMAMFGSDSEEVFMKGFQARRYIEVSAGALVRDATERGQRDEARQRRRRRYEADIWGLTLEETPELDRVSRLLQEFRDEITAICEPVIASQRKKPWSFRLLPIPCCRSEPKEKATT